MGKRSKFERRLQKALNHTNKTIKRLYQLDEMEESDFINLATGEARTLWWFLAQEYEGFRRRLLYAAMERGIELNEEGMPR